MLRRAEWKGTRSGPRVFYRKDGDGTLVMYLRLGQTVDQTLVDELSAIASEVIPELDARPPLTYSEAAEALGVSTKWLQRRVSARTIPFTMLGKRVRFLPEHIREIREQRAREVLS